MGGHLDGSGQDGRQVILFVGLEALGADVPVQVDGQHRDAQDRLLDAHLRNTESNVNPGIAKRRASSKSAVRTNKQALHANQDAAQGT